MMDSRKLAHDWFPRALPDNVELGGESWLYSTYAFVHFRSQRQCALRVGRQSGLYNGTFFDLGPEGEVAIGDYCTLVGAIISTNRRIVIGDYVFIAHEVTIADHSVAVPPSEPQSEVRPRSNGGISIGDGAWIGARAVLLPGAHIGQGAIVGAACVVDMDVPPFAVVAGNPARIVRSEGVL
jgi:acetyltransferase-like isoleucine patch superfamily enzyme